MSQNGNHDYVQKPLQEIFSVYIDFHLSLVRQLEKNPMELATPRSKPIAHFIR